MDRSSFLRLAARGGPWVVLAAYTLLCLLRGTHAQWLPEWDSSLYLVTAQALEEGLGYTYLGQPFVLRPPGYPWLLTFFLDKEALLSACMAACVAGTAVLQFLLFRDWLGTALSVLVAILSGTTYVFTIYLGWTVSDVLALDLLLLSMWWLRDRTNRGNPWMRGVAGGLALAASMYVRSASLIVLPGLLLASVNKERRSRLLVATGVAVLAMMPWWLHARAVAPTREVPAEQLYLYDYSTAVWKVDPGDPSSALVPWSDPEGGPSWTKRLKTNGDGLMGALSTMGFGVDHALTRVAFLVLLGIGALLRWRREGVFGVWFPLTYSAVVLTYFTFNHRLLLPLVPFLLPDLVVGCRTVVQGFVRNRTWSFSVTLVLVIALLVHNMVLYPARTDVERWEIGGIEQQVYWNDMHEVAQWLTANTPPQAKVLCNRAPVYTKLAQRRCYTWRFQRRPEMIERYDIDYVLFDEPPPGNIVKEVERHAAEVTFVPSQRFPRGIPIYRIRPRN